LCDPQSRNRAAIAAAPIPHAGNDIPKTFTGDVNTLTLESDTDELVALAAGGAAAPGLSGVGATGEDVRAPSIGPLDRGPLGITLGRRVVVG
jgi:hypothetical protein